MIRDCPFCNIRDSEIKKWGAHAVVIEDQYPVSPGHLLIVPKVHVENYLDVMKLPEVRTSMLNLLDEALENLESQRTCAGYNIGWNIGKYAGQTVFHCHMHVIPRYKDGPRNDNDGYSGIRYSVPGKGDY